MPEKRSKLLKKLPYPDTEALLFAVQMEDERLIDSLLSFPEFRDRFFRTVRGCKVFLQKDFIRFLRPGEKDQVRLNWSGKEAFLAGGAPRRTIESPDRFLDPLTDHLEIQALFRPKSFHRFSRLDSKGERPLKAFSKNQFGEIDDNLIIKGDNLVVMNCLKGHFGGRFKFVYIDPPYSTGSDLFQYNDRFQTATWLTFMKNRLEVAKSLMSADAVIAVQCSFHRHAQLKVLMDEIFPRHMCSLNIQVRHPDRVLTLDKEFNDVMEHILIYGRSEESRMPRIKVPKTDEGYVHEIELIGDGELMELAEKKVEVYRPGAYRLIKGEPGPGKLKKISIRGTLREKNNSGRIYVRNLEELVPKFPPMTLFRWPGIGADGLGYRYFYTPALKANGQRRKNGGYFQGRPLGSRHTLKPYPNYFNFVEDYSQVRKEGGVDLRNGKKPEALMRLLIEMFSSPGDRILDYHLGSGTTCAVAHKLNRRYVGIEEMDYIREKSLKRLSSVIGTSGEIDQTGVSRALKWNGGGSLVYFELKEKTDKNDTGYEDLNVSGQSIENQLSAELYKSPLPA